MARTTDTAVREILNTALPTNQLKAFIEDVSLWVTEMLANQVPAPSAARLEIIERYLSCAMVKLRELTGGGLTSTTIGDVTESYSVPAAVRDYLDTAAGFDASGIVRRHFLAPRPASAPVQPTYGMQAITGKLFTDDVVEEP